MNAPKSAPNGLNPDLVSARIPFVDPEWKDEEEEEEDDEEVNDGNKELISPLVKP